MSSLDAKTFKSINGDEGGVWAPSSPIVVGGSGMTVTLVGVNTAESLFVTGTLDSAFGSNAWFRGNTGFRDGSATSVRDGATWSFNEGSITTFQDGSTLDVHGSFNAEFLGVTSIQVADSLYTAPDSVTNLSGNLSVSQITQLHGSVTIEGDASLQGNTTVSGGGIQLSGSGTITERCAIGANSNATYSVNSTDVVWVNANDQTGSWIYTIDDVGVAVGKKMRICYFFGSSSHTIEIRRANVTSIAVLGNSSSYYNWIDIQFINGRWQLVAGGKP